MAIVTVKFDTEKKTSKMDINGSVVKDFSCVIVERYVDSKDNHCENSFLRVEMQPKQRDGLTYYSHVSASEGRESLAKCVCRSEDGKYVIFNVDEDGVKKGAAQLLARQS